MAPSSPHIEWDGKKHHITLEEMQQEISELPEYKQRQYQDKEGLETYMLLMAESRLILSLARDRKLNEDPGASQEGSGLSSRAHGKENYRAGG